MRIVFDVIGNLFANRKASTNTVRPQEPHRIFIGYDERQALTYNVLQHSIVIRASHPVAITPLVLQNLPIERRGLTPFTYSRFLVPWLCGFRGWAVFLDSDMLMLDDVHELFDAADERFAVMVAKSSEPFEWSSMMLMNCAHPANRVLLPHFIADVEACKQPHNFDWLDENQVGDLPLEWNHTVGYDPERKDAKLVHFTQGVPLHLEVDGCEYSEAWHAERERMVSNWSWVEIMGQSVHAATLPSGQLVPKLAAVPESPAGHLVKTDAAKRHEPPSPPEPSTRYLELIELYRELHAHGDRHHDIPAEETFSGVSLFPHISIIAQLCRRTGAKQLLDYGCGKASAYRDRIRLQDGTLIENLESFWGVDGVWKFDPGYPPYSERPSKVFDGVICTDVLEHCPEEDIQWILSELFGFARRFVFMSIACRPAIKSLPTGENAHITVHPPDWWRTRLQTARRTRPSALFLAVCGLPDGQQILIEG